MRDLDEKALQAKEKKATLGPDIDLGVYKSEPVPRGYPQRARKSRLGTRTDIFWQRWRDGLLETQS